MSDDELFEKLEELVKLSDHDNACAMEKRDNLWNDVTKDIRDNLIHFLLMYTNILVDKGKIDKSSKELFAFRILSSINNHVMEDLKKIFDTKEK